MMTSQRFKILEQELKNLRKYFLPHQFKPDDNYTSKEIAHAIAFCVLTHAEIEAYLEDRVLEVALYAKDSWSRYQKITLPFACLLAFSGQKLEEPPASLSSQKLKSLEDKFSDIFLNFKDNITNKNHGIREKNIIQLLLPIGIRSNQIDETWLQEIDNFSRRRGNFAHQSATKKMQQVQSPEIEYNFVFRLIYGYKTPKDKRSRKYPRLPCLMDIDQLLNELLNS